MPTKTLVLEAADPFFLAADSDGVRLGENPDAPAGVIPGARVLRVRCVIELETDDDGGVRFGETDDLPAHDLAPGESGDYGPFRVTVAGDAPAAEPEEEEAELNEDPDEEDEPEPAAPVGRRFAVIDGANQGQTFRLPAAGAVTVGKAGKGADIGLDDLYVTRLHCRVTVEPDCVLVEHLDGANGTLLDGARIEHAQLVKPGSVVRVGNSHLRLELGVFADEPAVGQKPPPRPAAAPARPAADPFEKLEGQTLGHYKVGPAVGRGHAGAVFRATDARTGHELALKVLAPEFPASAAELEAFSKAVKEAQPVRHPNLLNLVGAGRTGPFCWIAREYVAGASAAEIVGRVAGGEKPSWTQAARVGIHLARALGCVHQHGLIHGNVTPRHVLIRAEDKGTRLADLLFEDALAGSRLWAAVAGGKRAAELPYLAPEQLDPDGAADARADQYAAGAVVYALVTGRPPSAGPTAEVVREVARRGKTPRPSAVYKTIPAAFDAVVMRMLAFDPDDRYQSAAAVLEDLEPLALAHDVKL